MLRYPALFLTILVAMVAVPVQAKRKAPPEVRPVMHEQVRYEAPNDGDGLHGIVEARNAKSGKLMWRQAVYTLRPKAGLETDVQAVFIASLRIEGGELIATDERGARHAVDLATHAVRTLGAASRPPPTHVPTR